MMDNDNSLNKRPTFKRALRNISMTSIFITMMLIWLLLSVTSVLTLKQYAQKNLALTAATMTYSLEAAVVFADGPAATETLAALGQQGQFSTAEVRDKQQNILASWHYNDYSLIKWKNNTFYHPPYLCPYPSGHRGLYVW